MKGSTHWTAANTECVADNSIATLEWMPDVHEDASGTRDGRRTEKTGEKASNQDSLNVFCSSRPE
jgi:hypothetical protein